jgi:hypothetical protein
MTRNLGAQCLVLLFGTLAACGGGGVATAPSGGTGGASVISGSGGGAGVDLGSGGVSGSGGQPAGSGGASDAGEIDQASADDASKDTGAGEACAGLFCEDFEDGQIDPAKWSIPTGGSTFTVQQKIVAHGKYAVQFHGVANLPSPDYAYMISKNAPAALQKHNFGRAYFYLTPKARSTNMGLMWGGTTGFPRPAYLSIANHASGWQLGFINLKGPTNDEVQTYPRPDIPVATWTCLEWEFNDQPDELNLWGNGVAIGTMNDQHIDFPGGRTPGTPLYKNSSSGLIGAFTDFGFGYYDWHPQGRPAFDLYYDDIVLDTKRVGCLP